jgi:hypothetical protein
MGLFVEDSFSNTVHTVKMSERACMLCEHFFIITQQCCDNTLEKCNHIGDHA